MKKIILAFALISISNCQLSIVNAQEEKNTYNESVLVRGSYRPVIEETEKLLFPAVVTDTLSRVGHTFTYTLAPSRINTLYQPSGIKAARIVGEPTAKLYNNYLRLGFGNYWTPLADLYLTSTRDTAKTYGIRLNHRSSWGSLPNYGKNHFGLTDISLFGKLIVANCLQLHSRLSYQHDHNLYYGFSDNTLASVMPALNRDDINLSDIRAKYNQLIWNIGVRNMQLDANKLGYDANLRLSDLWASWGQNEFNLNLTGNVHYGFDLRDRYRGVAFLAAEWDGYSLRYSPDGKMPLGFIPTPLTGTYRGHRNIVCLNPYAEFLLDGFQLHAGLTTAWDGFTKSTVKLYFFPDVVVSKQFLDNSLALSLGVIGGLHANSLAGIRIINPYITPGAEQRATKQYDFTGCMRWTLSKKVEANVQIQYSILKDDLTFTLDPDYSLDNVFCPFYFDNKRLTLGADIAFVNDEMLTLRTAAHYYRYTSIRYNNNALSANLTSFHAPLYRPDWDFLLAADVNYNDRWLFHLETELLGKMRGDLGKNLPLRLGIGAEVEYRHTRALSFFLRLENLALQRYHYWTNYPSQKGVFLLGLTYTL